MLRQGLPHGFRSIPKPAYVCLQCQLLGAQTLRTRPRSLHTSRQSRLKATPESGPVKSTKKEGLKKPVAAPKKIKSPTTKAERLVRRAALRKDVAAAALAARVALAPATATDDNAAEDGAGEAATTEAKGKLSRTVRTRRKRSSIFRKIDPGAAAALAELPVSTGLSGRVAARVKERLNKARVTPPKDVADTAKAARKRRTPSPSALLSEASLGVREVKTIKTGQVRLQALDVPRGPVPRLAYGLDRVLFNQGVTELRDTHSRVYNFDPFLEKILPVAEFDFSTMKSFTTSSKDPTLKKIVDEQKKKFVGSSSSMTGLLKHFHYLLSSFRPPAFDLMSYKFPGQKEPKYTKIQLAPEAVFLRWKNGTYAIDADKEYDSGNILSFMGQYMEKLLTVPQDVFERHRVGHSHTLTEEDKSVVDAFHYSTVGDIVMRSQLDAYNPKLPGSGMFDLKTRAVLPIRMSMKDYEWGMDYEIRSRRGEFHSFEREYYDMIRATLVKYSLQARMGRMDGIFVAYHNIRRIFGFQYIPLQEMDVSLHGQGERALGDQEFAFSLKILSDVLNKAAERFPEQTLRIHAEARMNKSVPHMYFFAEPVTEEEVDAIQSKTSDLMKAFEKKLFKIDSPEDEAALQARDDKRTGVGALSDQDKTIAQEGGDGAEAAPGDSSTSADTDFLSTMTDEADAKDHKPLLALVIEVQSKVNGKVVERPEDLKPTDEWELEYSFAELEKPARAWGFYGSCRERRRDLFWREEVEEGVEDDHFVKVLKQAAKEGRKWREGQDQRDKGRPIVMWDDPVGEEVLAAGVGGVGAASAAAATPVAGLEGQGGVSRDAKSGLVSLFGARLSRILLGTVRKYTSGKEEPASVKPATTTPPKTTHPTPQPTTATPSSRKTGAKPEARGASGGERLWHDGPKRDAAPVKKQDAGAQAKR